MDNQQIIKILTKYAKGFFSTQVTKEFKKGETVVTKIKRQFIPFDIRALQLLIHLTKSAEQNDDDVNRLTLEQTIKELRVAVRDSEQTINDYESALKNH